MTSVQIFQVEIKQYYRTISSADVLWYKNSIKTASEVAHCLQIELFLHWLHEQMQLSQINYTLKSSMLSLKGITWIPFSNWNIIALLQTFTFSSWQHNVEDETSFSKVYWPLSFNLWRIWITSSSVSAVSSPSVYSLPVGKASKSDRALSTISSS